MGSLTASVQTGDNPVIMAAGGVWRRRGDVIVRYGVLKFAYLCYCVWGSVYLCIGFMYEDYAVDVVLFIVFMVRIHCEKRVN